MEENLNQNQYTVNSTNDGCIFSNVSISVCIDYGRKCRLLNIVETSLFLTCIIRGTRCPVNIFCSPSKQKHGEKVVYSHIKIVIKQFFD